MNRIGKSTTFKFALTFAAILMTVSAVGCIQEMATLLYVIKGHETPPAFNALKDKRVAIVCLSDASAYGPDALSYTITKQLAAKVTTSKEKINVVSPSEVEEFVDLNGWDESSVGTLGEAVGADYVIAVKIGSYSIKDGPTLFKGRSDLHISVFDVADAGRLVFDKGPDEFVFPENGRPITQTTARQFEAFYVARLTDYIAKLFTTHDYMDSFAEDAMMQ